MTLQGISLLIQGMGLFYEAAGLLNKRGCDTTLINPSIIMLSQPPSYIPYAFQNTVQAVLISDGESSFAIFRHDLSPFLGARRVWFRSGERRRAINTLDDVDIFRINGKALLTITVFHLQCFNLEVIKELLIFLLVPPK